MTPEGRVKKEVKSVLDIHKPSVYYEMNVPGGYGKSGLDFIGVAWGLGFAIETKAARKTLSDRQEGTRTDLRAAGARVFEIIGEGQTGELAAWLERVKQERGQVDMV